MELFTNQVLSGIATGAIYACIALAVVMIYEAIDHLNFAQGEMAMFSTFIAWQCMQWGVPYWGAFVISVALSFVAGVAIERVLFRPLGHASILVHIAGFIALFAIINSVAGLIWDFTIKPFPTPFGATPLFGGVISSHQAGMIVVTLALLGLHWGVYLFAQQQSTWVSTLVLAYAVIAVLEGLFMHPPTARQTFESQWFPTAGIDLVLIAALLSQQGAGIHYSPLLALPVRVMCQSMSMMHTDSGTSWARNSRIRSLSSCCE